MTQLVCNDGHQCAGCTHVVVTSWTSQIWCPVSCHVEKSSLSQSFPDCRFAEPFDSSRAVYCSSEAKLFHGGATSSSCQHLITECCARYDHVIKLNSIHVIHSMCRFQRTIAKQWLRRCAQVENQDMLFFCALVDQFGGEQIQKILSEFHIVIYLITLMLSYFQPAFRSLSRRWPGSKSSVEVEAWTLRAWQTWKAVFHAATLELFTQAIIGNKCLT